MENIRIDYEKLTNLLDTKKNTLPNYLLNNFVSGYQHVNH